MKLMFWVYKRKQEINIKAIIIKEITKTYSYFHSVHFKLKYNKQEREKILMQQQRKQNQ